MMQEENSVADPLKSKLAAIKEKLEVGQKRVADQTQPKLAKLEQEIGELTEKRIALYKKMRSLRDEHLSRVTLIEQQAAALGASAGKLDGDVAPPSSAKKRRV